MVSTSHSHKHIKTGGNPNKNPFIWLNPNDKTGIYTAMIQVGIAEELVVRISTSSLNGLKTASDNLIIIAQTYHLGLPL